MMHNTISSSSVSTRTPFNKSRRLTAADQASIFEGAFLDPQSSAVYGVFFFFGCYFFGFIRAKMPRM